MSGIKIQKALIIYNKPLYELHILEKKDPHFLGLLRSKHPTTKTWKAVYESHHQTLKMVEKTLQWLGIKTDVVFRGKLKKVGNYDLVVTVGGDGTFLDTSHYLDSQVLLGVNSVPFDSTGALCRARLDNFLSMIIDLLSGTQKPKTISRLKLKINGKALPYSCVNEVLFSNQSPAGTSRYMIQKGRHSEEQKSSGIWIATATGSTAAIRSAGGTVLPITQRGMQFAVREIFPEKNKKFCIAKGILSPREKLVIFPKMRQGAVFIDGNHLVVPVRYGDKIEISADAKPLRAIL